VDSQEVHRRREQSKADIERMLARAAQCEKASEALDREIAGLGELENLDHEGKAADTKVGDAIVKARLKPESIQIAWDFDRDGKVSRKEALVGIRQLPGITKEISDEELEAMYDAVFDSNKDGVLDVEEARTAFKVLKGKKKAWDAERKELLQKVVELEAAAASEQQLVVEQEAEEVELLAAREANAKAEAEARAVLEAEKAALEAAGEKAKAEAKATRAKHKEQLEAERAAAAKARNPGNPKASKKAAAAETAKSDKSADTDIAKADKSAETAKADKSADTEIAKADKSAETAKADKAAADDISAVVATTKVDSTTPAEATPATPATPATAATAAAAATPRSRDKPGASPVLRQPPVD